MKWTSVTCFVLSFAAATSAQSSSGFASEIPQCSLACDAAGIAAAGCTMEDFACHCRKTATIRSYVAPCLAMNSTCTPAEISQLYGMVAQYCTPKNMTGGAGPTAAGTGSYYPTQTYSPAIFTGAASRAMIGAGLLGLIGATVAGTLL